MLRHSRPHYLAGATSIIALTAAVAWADDVSDSALKIQGEYSGVLKAPNSEFKVGVQVIALGEDKFHAVALPGGLPGDGWDGNAHLESDGELKEGAVVFPGDQVRAELKDGVIRVRSGDGEPLGQLERVERKSPTLGAKPPEGAVVLFEGSNAGYLFDGKMTNDGLLIAGATSKRRFQSCQLHVEFLLPFMPAARGQARGNSGCYLQGRYEVQMLDSFGLEGLDNECGGIYRVAKPSVNMCYPPETWQTYDIDFTAAKYEGDKKVKNATITVQHNGVEIHKDVELPHATTAAPLPEGPAPGPIYLQDHGNPVRYRNIWVVEK